MQSVFDAIEKALEEIEIDPKLKSLLIENLMFKINQKVNMTTLSIKLQTLYEYEKHYLELIKEYKEEIKFANTIQEDLRKERAKFFAETLDDVSETLKKAQVDDKVASKWLEELVNSYTKSLDLSSGLIEENTLETIGKLKKDTKTSIKESELKEDETD